jgi:hypothetical protein
LSIAWSFENIAEAGRAALREERDLTSLQLDERVQNRVAWAQALAASQGPAELLSKIGMTEARAGGLRAFDVATEVLALAIGGHELGVLDADAEAERAGLGDVAAANSAVRCNAFMS